MDAEVIGQILTAARPTHRGRFDRLYRHFGPIVCGYLRAQGADDPEDVTNEVFLGAFPRLGAFSGDGAVFRSWLFTIAHHPPRLSGRLVARSGSPPEPQATLGVPRYSSSIVGRATVGDPPTPWKGRAVFLQHGERPPAPVEPADTAAGVRAT